MAITKITDPGAVPTTVADYEAQNIQLDRLLGDSVQPYPVSGSNVVKGALFNIGGDMFYCGADTAISGTPSDYVKLVASGSTAAASFVSSLSGVAWNPAYNGYYNGVDLYLFDEVKAVLAGAISGYKTAMGAMWMLNAGQGLKSTDSPIFAGATVNNDLNVNGGIKTDGTFLKTKVLEIGDWDMTSSSYPPSIIYHGLNISKIRSVSAIIRMDNGLDLFVLSDSNPSGYNEVSIHVGSTYIELRSPLGGKFDNINFDKTSFNRGYITIIYET